MALTKIHFEVLDKAAVDRARGLLDQFDAQFNPADYTLAKGAQFAEIGIPGVDSPILQFVRGDTERLTLELLFDTTESGMGDKALDVTTLTRHVYQLVKIQPATHAAPRFRVTWGKGLSFTAVAEQVQQRFTLFSPAGIPLRATVTLTMAGVQVAGDPTRRTEAPVPGPHQDPGRCQGRHTCRRRGRGVRRPAAVAGDRRRQSRCGSEAAGTGHAAGDPPAPAGPGGLMSTSQVIYQGQDFYVPAFEVNPPGKRMPRDVLHDVLDVTYRDGIGEVDSFSITVNNWDSAKRTFKYSETSTFLPGKKLDLWVGYRGKGALSRLMTGEITAMRPSFPASGRRRWW